MVCANKKIFPQINILTYSRCCTAAIFVPVKTLNTLLLNAILSLSSSDEEMAGDILTYSLRLSLPQFNTQNTRLRTTQQ